MKAQDYLYSELSIIAEKYNDIKIRCEYRPNTQTHLIEIIPLNLFEKNGYYIQDEIRLETTFLELYPKEDILFITEGSLNEIRTADFEFGYNTFTIENIIAEEFEIAVFEGISNTIETIKYDFALAA